MHTVFSIFVSDKLTVFLYMTFIALAGGILETLMFSLFFTCFVCIAIITFRHVSKNYRFYRLINLLGAQLIRF